MALSAGTKLGPYEIVAPLGAGGMGEVYRARDTRLGRDVAIKVLPTHLADRPDLRERFEREARAIASLNHSHICTLHDIGRQDATDYLVMELVEGQTLAQRLLKGPLPIEQVLQYAIEIAGALDKAHHNGITHRDLKPGNIMLTKSGVKLLDFGLAKLTREAAVTTNTVTTLPAAERSITAEGSIIGTLQYMAPEQLEGAEADARTDIFSFGVVVYEMATGKKAFDGKSQASLIAKILETDPPPISSLQPMTPPALDRVVKKCLAKEPEKRWQDAGDLCDELKWLAETGAPPEQVSTAPRRRSALIPAIACVLVAAAAGAAGWLLKPAPASGQRMQLAVPLPDEMSTLGFARLSPDGRRVVLGIILGNRLGLLVLRSLDSSEIQPLPGITNARSPFWSADSRRVGFYSGGKLETVSVNGGPAQVLCDASLSGYGGAWNSDGVILFVGNSGPLQRVNASGGACTPVMKGGADENDDSPAFLPDGKHFLYRAKGGDESTRGIYVASLDNPAGQRLLTDQSSVVFAPSTHGSRQGYLLFLRGTTLTAQPFDTGTLQLAGDAFPVAEQAAMDFNNQVAASASANGVLFYMSNLVRDNQLTWFDRSGKILGTAGPHGLQNGVSLSRDDKVVAIGRNFSGSDAELWLEDLVRGGATPFTFDPTHGRGAVWSPDGDQIIFASTDGKIYRKDANGGGPEEPLLAGGDPKYPSDWSRDGRFLLYTDQDPKTGADIWVLPDPSGKSGESKPFPFLQTQFMESQSQFSPDGRWIAYASNKSGQEEIYVRPFSGQPSGSAGEWKISTDGGADPRWSANGKELFYLAREPSGHFKVELMTVPIHTIGSATFEAGAPKPLFDFVYTGVVPQANVFGYAVAADGQRFLVNPSVNPITTTLNVIVNWEASVSGNK
jgi:serine/threonine protein kinase/WD40 repeat protein